MFRFPTPNFQHPLAVQSQGSGVVVVQELVNRPCQILYTFHKDGREVERVGDSQGNDCDDIISLPPVYNTIGTFCPHWHVSELAHNDPYQSGSRAL